MSRIIPIPVMPLGIVNAFLVTGGRPVLVDAGMPGTLPKFAHRIRKAGFVWPDISLIIITHAHYDHIGTATEIRQRTGAPVMIHDADRKFMEAGEAPLLTPTSKFAARFSHLTTKSAKMIPCPADIVINKAETDLRQYGIDGKAIFTPGHTSGSLSVLLSSGDVIAGDLLAGGILFGGIIRRRHPMMPFFMENIDEAKKSLTMLLERGAKRFYLGHGGPIPAERVKEFLDNTD